MSDNVFSNLDTEKDNPIHLALSNALDILVNALVDEKNTNISKRELKSISILKQNPYIWNIIKDYVPNKRYVKSAFGKDIQQAISKISNAIGQVETDKENDGKFTKFFNRFR